MSSIQRKLAKIREMGPMGLLKRALGGLGYALASPVVRLWLDRFVRPDPKRIVFFSTPSFADNALSMYRWLKAQEDCADLRFTWLLFRDSPVPAGEGPRTAFVSANSWYHGGYSLGAQIACARAGVIFFTHTSPARNLAKKPGQTIVNLWHGCGYKDAQGGGPSFYQTNPFDLALVPGPVFVGTKSKFWGCPKEKIAPIGYPRYDELLSPSPRADAYRKKLCPKGEKLVLWLPTFRKSVRGEYAEEHIAAFELPPLADAEELRRLDALLAQLGIVLCVKRHPSQVRYKSEELRLHHVVFIAQEDLEQNGLSLYELLPKSDALISDYSSAAIDYMLVDKPIAFALSDYEEYKKARGFVFEDPLHYMPGHHLYGAEDMAAFLRDVAAGRDPNADQRHALMGEVQNPCEHYAQRVWEKVNRK